MAEGAPEVILLDPVTTVEERKKSKMHHNQY
jgi:hypothetical protein